MAADGDTDPGSAAILYKIVSDADIVATHRNPDNVEICSRRSVAGVGVHLTVVRRRKVRYAGTGLVDWGGRHPVVVQDIVINREVIPKSDINQIVRVGVVSGDKIVMDTRGRSA